MARLLALDLDGTLLDSTGALRPAVRRAVRAAAAHAHVLICTGRRYRSAQPLLQALDLNGPVVTQNGTVVREARTGETMARTCLDMDVALEALELMRSLCPPLVFVDRYARGVDILSEPFERLHEIQQGYLSSALAHTHFVATLERRHLDEVLMLSCMAQRHECVALQQRLLERFGDAIRTHLIAHKNYPGHIVEVVSAKASKWYALAQIAQTLNVASEAIVAIGDDHNDAMMLQRAGVGVAMGNAMPGVSAFANHTTATNDEDGAALAIHKFVLDTA